MGRPRETNYRLRQYGKPGREVWYICYSDGKGSKRQTTGCRDRSEAEAVLAEFLAALMTPVEPEAKTVASILQGYVGARAGIVVDHDRLKVCEKALSHHLGWMEPAAIKPSTSALYVDLRRKDGAMTGTIRRELGCLRAAMNWALSEDWIGKAPAIKLPKPPPPKDRWLTKGECVRLLDACVSPHVRLFVSIALNTGARKGAIADLTWQRVDLERRLIDFNPQGRDRTSKGRPIVPINDTLLSELRVAAEIRTTDYVVEWNGKPAGNIKKAFERACIRAKLEDVTPHVLRHTAATHMAMAGIDMWMISKMLGHTNSAITESVYGHHHPDYLRGAAEKLG